MGSCPLCFNITFEAPQPPVPRLLHPSRVDSRMRPPRLLHHRRVLVRSRVWLDDGSIEPLLSHSVEVLVYEQLVSDEEAQGCFRCASLGRYVGVLVHVVL